jgi:hypothetical protein
MKQSLKDNAVVVIIGVVVLVGTLVWTVITSVGDSHRAEVEFKNDLVGRISEPSSDALTTGAQIVDGVLPEEIGLPADEKQHVEYAEYQRVRGGWVKTRYAIGGKLAPSFPPAIVNGWNAFSDAVEDYLKISSPRSRFLARRRAAEQLAEYLHPANPQYLHVGWSNSRFNTEYVKARTRLGEKLQTLTSDLNGADAQQFNSCIWFVCL